jgi:O-acetylserine/cysteine efflux transporter
MIDGRNIRWCFIIGGGRLVSVSRRDTCLAILVAALWGFNFVVIDWGMGSVPPLLFAAIRFTVVAVPACFFIKRPPVPWKTIAGVGGFMSLGQFGLLYLSMHLGMPPGLAALVLQAQVVFTIVIAAMALRERPSRAQVAGVALGVAGLLVVAAGKGGHVPAIALVLCLLAGLSWGAGNVVSRAARAPLPPGEANGVSPRTPRPGGLALTVWSATIVPVPLLSLSLLVDGPRAVASGLAHIGWDGIASTAYTAGLCSLVGYAIFNRLLSSYPSAHVVPWVLLAPVVAMGSSWALLGEVPSPAELAGALVLIAGVLVSQRAGGRSIQEVTERALRSRSPESIPKATMRVGRMRTMVSSKLSPKALPPAGSTSAVPRISIIRGCQGGSTSSTTMLALPARSTSRVFLVWLIRRPPTSMASASAL